MRTVDLIRAKRAGEKLGEEGLHQFATGLADGSVSDGQAAAFAMAVCLQGMDAAETGALTDAMARSGEMLAWDEGALGGPVLDKHSTGGVGDKVSLLLVPMLAACGAYVPMITGRGLGHTGGTLDKLEAWPGFRSELSPDELRQQVASVGGAFASAGAGLAPADRTLYAVRDQTATVDSIPLITSSILSKKIAAGIKRLLVDVKVGNGAFMRDMAGARELAQSLVDTAATVGMQCMTLLTDMDAPLGRAAGNAVELQECVGLLAHGKGEPRLMEVTVASVANLLVMGGLAADLDEGRAKALGTLTSGSAAEALALIVAAQGGSHECLSGKDGLVLAAAPVCQPVHPETAGTVAAIDTMLIGEVVVALGGGRAHPGAAIDHRVGLDQIAGRGEQVGPGSDDRPLAVVHAADQKGLERAVVLLRSAFVIQYEAKVNVLPPVQGMLS